MPRSVPAEEKLRALNLMLTKDETGQFIHGQREIERETGLSRPYLRKLAKSINHQFSRNGIEIKGQLCMCVNCDMLFRRPKSKVIRAVKNFCDLDCKNAYFQGSRHPGWKTGNSAKSWSTWVVNSGQYKQWKEKVLEQANFACEITGLKDDLSCHHIEMKSLSPEKSFLPENGIVLNKKVHTRMHQLMSQGKDFEECKKVLKEEFNTSNGE